MTNKNPYRLMAPGPVPIHPEILKLLALPMIHHRTPAFEKIFAETMGKLKIFFKTSQPVLALTTTGSGAMEAALTNTLSPGDEIIAIVSGKFGERWGKIAKAYGVICHEIQIPWGQSANLEDIKKAFAKFPNSKALCLQACETSTATQQPVQEICEYIKSLPHAISIVDGITAVGSMPLKVDKWGIDILISGSQKAFMLPTGLSMIALSKKAWSFNKTSTCHRFYLDLKKELAAYEQNQTQFSSPVSHFIGLNKALDILLGDDEGATSLKKIQLMASSTREFFSSLDIPLLANQPADSTTAFCFPESINGEKFRKLIEEKYNITVIGGQDDLKGKIIRIGHLGYITDEDLIETLKAIGTELKAADIYKYTDKQLASALQTLEAKVQGNLW